jgi:hypothetical protein
LSGATILDVTYGYEVRSLPDEMIDLAVRVVDDATFNASPGTRPVDIFPWGEIFCDISCVFLALHGSHPIFYLVSNLPSWLPGLGFKREAMELHARLMEFVNRPYLFALNQSVSSVNLIHSESHLLCHSLCSTSRQASHRSSRIVSSRRVFPRHKSQTSNGRLQQCSSEEPIR